VFMHIDVNSAYLSWEAAWRLQHGEKIDLRKIPSVVGGSQATLYRHLPPRPEATHKSSRG